MGDQDIPDGVKIIRKTARKVLIVIGFGISKIGVNLAKFSRLDMWEIRTFLMVPDGVKDIRMTVRKLP